MTRETVGALERIMFSASSQVCTTAGVHGEDVRLLPPLRWQTPYEVVAQSVLNRQEQLAHQWRRPTEEGRLYPAMLKYHLNHSTTLSPLPVQ